MLKYLDTNDLHKFKILTLLDEKKSSSVSYRALSEELGLSVFQIKNLVSEIERDLATYELQNYFTLDLTTGRNSVKFNRTTEKSIYLLVANYAKHSKFQQLVHFILSEQGETIFDLEDYLFISRSQVYRLIRKFEELVKDYDVKITKNLRFEGTEWNIREFLYQFYTTLYSNCSFPCHSEKLVLYKEMIESLNQSNLFPGKISDSKYNKLLYRLAVKMSRNEHGYAIENLPVEMNKNDISFQKVYAVLENYLQGSEKEKNAEVMQLVFFLDTEEFISIRKECEENKEIQVLNEAFLSIIKQETKGAHPFYQEESFIYHLTRIHRRLILCNRTNFNMAPYQNFDFFNSRCQIAGALSHSIIAKLINHPTTKKLIENRQAQLLFEYLFLLLNKSPESNNTDPIRIYVDFSYGADYNEYIRANIQLLKELDVQVVLEKEYTENQIDIYLSNSPGVMEYPFQVMWVTPPLASDWEELLKVIRRARNRKIDYYAKMS